MADVPVSIYYASKTRRDASPSIPSNSEDDPQPPVNPPGSGTSPYSYLTLTDTDDDTYTDKKDFVPHVNDTETGLILKRINKNVDGGFANSVYLEVQEVDGGNAFG